MDISKYNKVVLFDGICNLCNSSIDFLIRNEKGNELYFASLQSDFGRELIKKMNVQNLPDSIVFYSDNQLFYRSTALLNMFKFLKLPFRLLVVLRIVPRPIRDWFYKKIAKNRYAVFGKKESCRVPTEDEKGKFLG